MTVERIEALIEEAKSDNDYFTASVLAMVCGAKYAKDEDFASDLIRDANIKLMNRSLGERARIISKLN